MTCPTCGHEEIVRPADRCVSCGKELEPVFDDCHSRQYDNVLEVHLSGGYGMFFDNLDGDYDIFLCHECSHQACDALPWLGDLIQPLRSHSHRTEFWDANPNHEGWDKKPTETGRHTV